MLTICRLGPTTQAVGGNRYEFRLDAAGRAVCEVGYDHLPVFLARAEVYSVVDPIPDPLSQKADSGASDLRDGHGDNHSTASQVVTIKARRGRRGIDDDDALAEMRQLLAEGAGLNNAAEMIAAKVTEGEPRQQDATRKRLLRKHKEGKSR